MSESESKQFLAQKFWAHFQATRSDLLARLEALNTGGSTPNTLELLSLDVARLRKELTDATSYLPSYDQRQCESRLKETEESLANLRVASAPKPKFAFKRKANKPDATLLPSSTAPTYTPPGSSTADLTRESGLVASRLVIAGQSHTHFTLTSIAQSSITSQSDLAIFDLDHCVVDLLPTPGNNELDFTVTALHVRSIRNTVLLIPKIEGSALLHDLTRCVVALGCHQYRMHTSSHVDVYISVASNPIIEHCNNIRFSQYPLGLARRFVPETAQPMSSSGHLSVQDFSHIRPTPSPNWSLIPEGKLILDSDWPAGSDAEQANVDGTLQKLLPAV